MCLFVPPLVKGAPAAPDTSGDMTMTRRVRPDGVAAPSDPEAGLTLIEALIAVFVLSIAVLAIAAVSVDSLTGLRQGRNRQEATDLASAELEFARGLGFEDSVMLDAQVDPLVDPYVRVASGTKRFAHDCAGPESTCGGGTTFEDLVVDTAGGLDPYLRSTGRYTVRTYVTWADAGQTQKRVTTVVTWFDARRGPGQVRESTIIARSERGLAAPDFDITGVPAPLTAATATSVCLTQSIVNLGERDRHDVTIAAAVLNGVPMTGIDASTTINVGAWVVHPFIGVSPNPLPPPSTLPLPAVDQNGDARPDSQVFLDRNAALPLQLCYDVPSGATGTNTFDVLVRSAFDPSVQETFTHTITIGAPGPGGGTTTRYYLDFVNKASSINTRLHLMGTAVPTAVTLVDYDGTSPDTDADNLPGLRLARNTPAHVARFDFQNKSNAPLVLNGTATPRLWSSWKDALAVGSPAARQLSYEIRIEKLDTARNLTATLYTGYATYTHDSAGWEVVDVAGINFSGTPVAARSVAKNEWIRVSFACVDGTFGGTPYVSDDDCHLAFDTASQPASVVLGFQS